MNQEDKNLLVKNWIESNRLYYGGEKPSGELALSHIRVYDAIREEPELGWELILQILATDQSNETYMSLAAGPVEDLLVFHGQEFIERIEKQSANDRTFNEILGGVWRNSIDVDVWHRIEKIRKTIW